MKLSPSGFERSEYQTRLVRAQKLMRQSNIDGLLLTTEPEIRYFTGFLTRFWESPTRPWFLIVPVDSNPVAVISSIGAQLMGKCWIDDIRTWSAPDLSDDGISLLADALRECIGSNGLIGMPMGHETHVRMPLLDYHRLIDLVSPMKIIDDANILRDLRIIKSDAEIDKISMACTIAGRAFGRIGEIAGNGVTLDEVFRKFQILALEEGADWVPYLAGGLGQGGYQDVISPATSQKLSNGDILMLDTGLVHDGYFCDFDRNFAIGNPSETAVAGYNILVGAVKAGLEIARPGATASQLFHAMNNVVGNASDSGRLGHGLGMQLTEWPSLIAADHTILQEGMVLTLEPCVDVGNGKILVHEENIVIRSNGPEFLSPIAGQVMQIL